MSEITRQQRLKFARDHRGWTNQQWESVIWSDESKFLFRYNHRERVWRLQSEKFMKEAITSVNCHDKYIMVWGCFSARGVGELIWFQGKVAGIDYRKVIRNYLVKSIKRLFPNGNFIFMQDNDPKHKAHDTLNLLKRLHIPTMEWPPYSPDLNPIENLWSILDQKLKERTVRTEQELYDILEAAWNTIAPDTLTGLVHSMPQRCKEVIRNKGLSIDY
jgi:hypothetical protein